MHTFTAIYSISSLHNLLFTWFSSSSCQSGFFFFFGGMGGGAFLWSKQPKVLVCAVNLAIGTFSESMLSLAFLRALFLCPWTTSLVFARFRTFFHVELFWPKTRFWIFKDFTVLTVCFVKGGWSG